MSGSGSQIRPNDVAMPHFSCDLLLTGFGAFPGMPINPTQRLASEIACMPRWARLGRKVGSLVFPVSYAQVERIIPRDIVQMAPRAVLMLGVAGHSKTLRVERRATNHVSMLHRDAGAAIPNIAVLERGAPSFRKARAPLIRLQDLLREAHLPARISHSAGRYVCNAAYWQMLRALPASTRVVFIHVPKSSVGMRKRSHHPHRPNLTQMRAGLARIVRFLLS
jgi:pyroglutamyl-peptidase